MGPRNPARAARRIAEAIEELGTDQAVCLYQVAEGDLVWCVPAESRITTPSVRTVTRLLSKPA